MKITPQQEAVYIATGGEKCPFCASFMLNGDSYEIPASGIISQRMECVDCEKEWFALYRLFGTEPVSDE